MAKTMTRRQWISRTGFALGGTALAGCWGASLSSCAAEEQTSTPPIRMMYNENPYAPSPSARQAMTKAFEEANLYSFSRGDAYDTLREIIAEQVGLTPEHIIVSAGSTEILRVAALIAGLEGGEIIAPHPTYGTMLRYAESMGVKVHRVPVDKNLGFDLTAMREKMTDKVKLIYICNPNNPTGTITPWGQLRPFCEEMAQKAKVFVDEAYHEFVADPQYRSMVELVKEGHNVIVSRTASKIHGLAGLRVGFGIADPAQIRKLRARKTGTNNIIGLRAAIASYQDLDFQEFCRRKNSEAKGIVYRLFEKTGQRFLKSHTNFVFFHTGKPIEEFQKTMLEQGIIVGRPFPPFLDWCRLSMAKPEEMEIFVEAFHKVMG
ncbi:MAG: histidinol-phosphate transaminase [Candidatus Aminicenantes bacterium]|jgi:histidinol-phosphate aminotransferase